MNALVITSTLTTKGHIVPMSQRGGKRYMVFHLYGLLATTAIYLHCHSIVTCNSIIMLQGGHSVLSKSKKMALPTIVNSPKERRETTQWYPLWMEKSSSMQVNIKIESCGLRLFQECLVGCLSVFMQDHTSSQSQHLTRTALCKNKNSTNSAKLLRQCCVSRPSLLKGILCMWTATQGQNSPHGVRRSTSLFNTQLTAT